jgi:tetratricopeptide (TPR) repeat protein
MQINALRQSRWFPFAMVAVAAVVAFLPILRNGFTYDDLAVVRSNTLLPALLHPATYFSHFYFVAAGETTYRPLVSLSYALDYCLWAKAPLGYHVTNLALHAGVSVAFVAACLSLGAPLAVAAIAGLLYATHPLGSEATCSVGFREDLLCALFYLTAFALWPPSGHAKVPAERPRQAAPAVAARRRRPRQQHRANGPAAQAARGEAPLSFLPTAPGKRHGLALLFFALALLSKEMALSFPLLVLAKDLRGWRRSSALEARGSWSHRLAWHGAAWAMTAGALVLYLTFHHADAGFSQVDETGLVRRIAGFPTIALRYLGLFVFPHPLSVDRVIDLRAAWLWPASVGSAVLLGGIAFVLFRKRTRFPAAWEALIAFLLFLGPVSNLIRLDYPMAERYLALPLAPLCYVLAHALVRWLRPSPRRAVLGALLVGYVALSWARCAEWRSERTLWGAEECALALRYGTYDSEVQNNIGVTRVLIGDRDEAEKMFRAAATMDPSQHQALVNLARILREKGHYDEAVPLYRRALALQPDLPEALEGLGIALGSAGRHGEAVGVFLRWTQVQPGVARAYQGLGMALTQTNRREEARRYLEQGLAIAQQAGDAQTASAIEQALAAAR